MKTIRFWFQKTGRLKYISHLDVNRTVCRCIKQAELPIVYSSGFNPRPQLTFALPLSLGVESLCEVMDMKLEDNTVPEEAMARLNAALPDSMQVFRAAEAVHTPKEIVSARYLLTFCAQASAPDALKPEAISEKFAAYWSAPTLPVIKKNKSGEHSVDLKAAVSIIATRTEERSFLIEADFPAGVSVNLNPGLLIEDFCQDGSLRCEILRTHIYLAGGEEFY